MLQNLPRPPLRWTQLQLWALAAATSACLGCSAPSDGPSQAAAAADVQHSDTLQADADASPSLDAADAAATDAAVTDALAAADTASATDAGAIDATEQPPSDTLDDVFDIAESTDSSDAIAPPDVAVIDTAYLDVADTNKPDAALPDAILDAIPDAIPDAAVDAVGEVVDSVYLPDLPYDPTIYTPIDEFANPGWKVPEGMQSSPLVLCDPDAPPIAGKFIDVVIPAGIDLYRDDFWPAGTVFEGYEVREGGGQAVGDFNGDGRLDVYYAVTTGPERLYLAQPSGPWKFKGFWHYNQGLEDVSAVAADLDGDNDLDLIVGGHGVRMYRNDGPNPYTGVQFTDVTAQAGLSPLADLPYYAAAVADLDRDGILDVLISPLKFESPIPGYEPTGFYLPVLLRGKGGMLFDNVSSALPPLEPAPVYIASLVDLDGDGDQDIYFGRDFGGLVGPNQVLRNDLISPGAPMKFSNVSVLSGADIAGNTMGVALGDYDRDGLVDIFISGWQGGLHMLKNSTQPGKKPTFVDTTAVTKTGATGPSYASWGVSFIDIDNDSWLDLLVPNGHLTLGMGGDLGTFGDGGNKPTPGSGPGNGGSPGGGATGGDLPDNPESQYDNLYHANGDGTFSDWSVQSGFHSAVYSRGVAQGDFDRDGWPDVAAGSVKGPPRLLRNGCGSAAWLHVRLAGKGGNRHGIGARVTVIADGITQIRDIEAGSTSMWSSGELAAHFGLGTANQASLLMISWPSGKVQTFSSVPLRRRLIVAEP